MNRIPIRQILINAFLSLVLVASMAVAAQARKLKVAEHNGSYFAFSSLAECQRARKSKCKLLTKRCGRYDVYLDHSSHGKVIAGYKSGTKFDVYTRDPGRQGNKLCHIAKK